MNIREKNSKTKKIAMIIVAIILLLSMNSCFKSNETEKVITSVDHHTTTTVMMEKEEKKYGNKENNNIENNKKTKEDKKISSKKKTENSKQEETLEEEIEEIEEKKESKKTQKKKENKVGVLIFAGLGEVEIANRSKVNSNSVKHTNLEDIEPVTPEVDPERPLGDIEEVTPEVDPERPLGDIEEVTPEVDITEVIIWQNGEDVFGQSYTLDKNLEMKADTDGLKTIGGEIINNATINSNTENNHYGMYVEGTTGKGINNGVITGKTRGMGVFNGGIITNEENGEILNDGYYGMLVDGSGSTGINNGLITNKDKFGMYAKNGGKIINNKVVRNDGDYGMDVTGEGSIGINNGTIENTGKFGMLAVSGAKITNNGLIKNDGISGMVANGIGSEAINYGKIENTGNYRMNAAGGTLKNYGELTNEANYGSNYTVMNGQGGSLLENYGTISLDGEKGMGMSAAGNGGIARNYGTIEISGNENKGISVSDGAKAINEVDGVINLDGTNGTGIYANGSGTTVENKGTIILSDGQIANSNQKLEDSSGNKTIVLENNASFINTGTFIAEGTINFNDMGDGKFIMSEGGTIKAEKIEGDIYASGALAMGGYEDEYSTYKIVETNELNGEIISDSAMFDAHFTENADENGYYDVVLDRKDFNEIIEDNQLGEILEKNYVADGNDEKENYYDTLKLVSTEKQLNKAVEDSYGKNIYSTITHQTLTSIDMTNDSIKNYVIENRHELEVGEVIGIAGFTDNKSNKDANENILGYELDLKTVYFGAEKQLTREYRVGGLFNIGKMNVDYDDGKSNREDYQYQANLYFVYENQDHLQFTSMFFAGMSDSEMNRDLTIGGNSEIMNADLTNTYIGLNNQLSKKFFITEKGMYLKPKAELNLTYLMQGSVGESGSQAVNIDKMNSTSIELGVGLALGKDFYSSNGSKINLELSTTIYGELGNPYQDMDSTFLTLSKDKVVIDGYQGDNIYGDVMLRSSYQTPKHWTLFGEVGYQVGDYNNGWKGNIGINFTF